MSDKTIYLTLKNGTPSQQEFKSQGIFKPGDTGKILNNNVTAGSYNVTDVDIFGAGEIKITLSVDSVKAQGLASGANTCELRKDGRTAALTFFLREDEIRKNSFEMSIGGGENLPLPLPASTAPELIGPDENGDEVILWAWALPPDETLEKLSGAELKVEAQQNAEEDGAEYRDRQSKKEYPVDLRFRETQPKIGIAFRLSDVNVKRSMTHQMFAARDCGTALLTAQAEGTHFRRLADEQIGEKAKVSTNAELMKGFKLLEPHILIDTKDHRPIMHLDHSPEDSGHRIIEKRVYVPVSKPEDVTPGALKLIRWEGESRGEASSIKAEDPTTEGTRKLFEWKDDGLTFRLFVHLGMKSDITILIDFGSYSQQIAAVVKDASDTEATHIIEGQTLEFNATPRVFQPTTSTAYPDPSEVAQYTLFRNKIASHLRLDLRPPEAEAVMATSGDGRDDLHGLKARLFLGEQQLRTSEARNIPMEIILLDQFVQILGHEKLVAALRAHISEGKAKKTVGLAIAHPGHVNTSIYTRITKAASEALNMVLEILNDNPIRDPERSLIPGPVRGFSEPVAIGLALARGLTLSKGHGAEPARVLCVDIGHQTLDVAVLEQSPTDAGAPESDPPQFKLISYGSANAGATYLNLAICAVLAEYLCQLVPHFDQDIKNCLPDTEAALREAWKLGIDDTPSEAQAAQAAQTAAQSTLMARQQYAVRQIDLAKRLQTGDDDFRIVIASKTPGNSNKETYRSCLGVDLLTQILSAADNMAAAARMTEAATGLEARSNPTICIDEETGEVVVRLPLTRVLKATQTKRVLAAAKAVITDVANEAGLNQGQTDGVTIAGCGGQTRLFADIYNLVEGYARQDTGEGNIRNALGKDGKQALIKGLEILADDHKPLIADIIPPLHALEFDKNNALIRFTRLEFTTDERSNKETTTLTLHQDTAWIKVIDRGPQVLEAFKAEQQNDYLREAFFLAGLETGNLFRPPNTTTLEFSLATHVATHQVGENYLLGTFVINVSTNEPNGEWVFCSPGTVNQ